jgi:signal recognition particle GTPase
VPVKFLGVGEKSTDLIPFDAAEFAREVLEG